ncbi:MAG: hypothetical protein IT365_28220 [Candidatus Hydrogenedentes bacterium]|nr:hypothetical protein [Candidatus Hydrogenedentota bacterium]
MLSSRPSKLVRISFLSLIFIALTAGCQTRTSPIPESHAAMEADIQEAVFRFMFDHSNGTAREIGDFFFLQLPDAKDPSPDFMTRFDGYSPAVAPSSAATASPWTGVSHKIRGGKGYLFEIQALRWVDDKTVEVDVRFYEDGRSASGSTYRLESKKGKWAVADTAVHWIS